MMEYRYLRKKLQSMGPHTFENFIADIWAHYGFNTTVTSKSQDLGVDVIAVQQYPYSRKEVIQVKRYSDDNTIGITDVQRYSCLKLQEDADTVVIVTTGYFTQSAQSVAPDLDVKLIDGDQLCSMIHSDRLYPIFLKYATVEDSRRSKIYLEGVTDQIIANTGLGCKSSVYEGIRSYFERHPSTGSISDHVALGAYNNSRSGEIWEHSTTVFWPSSQPIDTEQLATHLRTHLERKGLQVVELPVLISSISVTISERLDKPFEEFSTQELAEWFINDFNNTEIPLIASDTMLAIDIAERVIDPIHSVAMNKLRVAGELSYRETETLV